MAHKPFYLSRKATQDLEGIWFYTFDTWSRAQADRYNDRLVKEIEGLASGLRRGRVDNVLSGVLRRTCGSHIIFYRDLPDRLEVIRILHSAQDVDRHLHD